MSRVCIQVVSKETIRPSSPTPSHLNKVSLTLIDQHEVQVFIPLLLFFPASDTPNIILCGRLKKSLSESLALFYPFAGKIVDNQFVHCNDDGISFSETRVNTQMARVLSHPVPEELVQLIPDNDTGELLSVQMNIFECGGMALCARLSHQVADASSFGFFLTTWAPTARGDPDGKIVRPVFAASTFFPPVEAELPPESTQLGTQPELVTKRFIFKATNITRMRDELSYRPTRVEAVSAFIWRCGMNALGWTSSALLQGMNLRTRMVPPLTNSFVGNITGGVLVKSTATEGSPPELECLVDQLHRAISKVDGDYVRKLQSKNVILELYDSFNEATHESFFAVTSWCRFPFYEADFGWGKSVWVTTVQLVRHNMIILMDTKCGTGIEAWITLKKQTMGKFECEPQLIAYTSST